MAVGSQTFEEIPVPQFKDKKAPDAIRVITQPLEVLIQHLLNRTASQESALHGARLQQSRQHEFLQLIPHPVNQGDSETSLGAMQGLPRHPDPFSNLL